MGIKNFLGGQILGVTHGFLQRGYPRECFQSLETRERFLGVWPYRVLFEGWTVRCDYKGLILGVAFRRVNLELAYRGMASGVSFGGVSLRVAYRRVTIWVASEEVHHNGRLHNDPPHFPCMFITLIVVLFTVTALLRTFFSYSSTFFCNIL